jgi:uncharacterized integral membrane protein
MILTTVDSVAISAFNSATELEVLALTTKFRSPGFTWTLIATGWLAFLIFALIFAASNDVVTALRLILAGPCELQQ